MTANLDAHQSLTSFPDGTPVRLANDTGELNDCVVPVDKPPGMSSFGVVRAVRRNTGIRKVGHAGTLDPMATGLLVVMIGAGTRKSSTIMEWQKEYEGTIRLGEETASYDAETPVLRRRATSSLSEPDILAAASSFVGTITQLTPAYSAVRIQGERSYRKARRGEAVKRPPRIVTVDSFDIIAIRNSDVDFRLTCSTGTYVRSIAHDLGQALDVGAHLTALRRTRIGRLHVGDSWQLDQMEVARPQHE